MSHPQEPTKGLLFFSLLYSNSFDIDSFLLTLEEKYSCGVLFSHSYFPMKNYYSKEMGEDLKRSFYVPYEKYPRDEIINSKIWAYEQELMFSENDKRKINIDSGMITLENFQLATFKNFNHRIYLGKNVFSDINIAFTKKSYEYFPWTYPDYKNPDITNFIVWARGLLKTRT